MNKWLATVIGLLLAGFPLALADTIPMTTTVSAYITATFQYSSVSFGTLMQGTSNNVPTPSHTTGAYNVTIDTNKEWKVTAYGSDFSDGMGHSFGISNLKMDTNANAGSLSVGSAVALSSSPQTIDTNMPYTDTINYHGFWLSIPAGQYASTYSTNVVITYSNV